MDSLKAITSGSRLQQISQRHRLSNLASSMEENYATVTNRLVQFTDTQRNEIRLSNGCIKLGDLRATLR